MKLERYAVLLALVILAAACGASEEGAGGSPPAGGESAPAATEPQGDASGSGRLLPLPGDRPERAHGGGSGPTDIHWTQPADWVSEPPDSSMRYAQYRIPGDAGEAECVVFYFGPGQGGDPQANVERWAGQFTQPDGRDSKEAMQLRRLQVGGLDVMVVEVSGIYDGGMGMTSSHPAEALQDYMMLAAIVEGPDAPWFFKLTGPAATVEAQREGFDQLLASIHIAEGA